MKTSNEHYGEINDRFDVRSALLRKLGFKYVHIEEWDTAVFARPRLGKRVPTTLAAAFVQLADDRTWNDRLNDIV